MKRYIRSDSLNSADYEGYDKYHDIVKGMVDQGDDEDDIRAYIRDLYESEKIENYEKNLLNRDLRNYLWDREQETMDPADLYGLAKGSYSVSAFTDAFGEMADAPRTVTDPGQAIKKWCQLQKKYPSCAMITGYKSDAQALRDWVVDHQDQISEWFKMYKVPYKFDWLIAECEKPVRPSSSKYDAPDQIHPFGLG